MKILITDQMFGPMPYYVIDEMKLTFDQLVDAVVGPNARKELKNPPSYAQQPVLQEVEENEKLNLRMCTTVWRANPETGLAEVWRMKWDSSG